MQILVPHPQEPLRKVFILKDQPIP